MTTLAEAEAPPGAFVPGIYDMAEDVYHGDPVPDGSLSVSGAKKLLPPSCPAKFAWERKHPPAPSAAMELGTAAHKLVLGVGQELAVIDADNWRTNKAKDEAAEAREEGKLPLLRSEHDTVRAMAEALRKDPAASQVLAPGRGDPERSLFWQDPETGIWRRSRLDYLPHPTSGRIIVADYKTCVSAAPGAISKAVYDYRYYMQDPWYCDGVRAMFPGADVAFLFVFQEKTPPYLVTVAQLDALAVQAGIAANRQAIERYRDCTQAGIWPGYTSEIELVPLPAWAERRYLQESL